MIASACVKRSVSVRCEGLFAGRARVWMVCDRLSDQMGMSVRLVRLGMMLASGLAVRCWAQRARGECVDTKAGPRMISRELTIVQKNETAHVSVVGRLTKPLLYQFRLAHE